MIPAPSSGAPVRPVSVMALCLHDCAYAKAYATARLPQSMANDAPLSKYQLVHNERISLDFRCDGHSHRGHSVHDSADGAEGCGYGVRALGVALGVGHGLSAAICDRIRAWGGTRQALSPWL